MSLDLTGFTNLVTVNCSNAGIANTLDVSALGSLTTLDCNNNAGLTTLILTGCTALTTLDCSSCNIGTLDVHMCSSLTDLDTRNNPSLHNIDGTTLTTMNNLHIGGTGVGDDFSDLVTLNADLTSPPGVDFSVLDTIWGTLIINPGTSTTFSIPSLTSMDGDLFWTGNTSVTSISLPNCGQVHSIFGSGATALTSLDLTGLTANLGPCDLHGCTSLLSLSFPNLGQNAEFDVNGCTSLTSIAFTCGTGIVIAGYFDASGCSSLASVDLTGIGIGGTMTTPADFTGCAISPSANINSILANCVLCIGGPPFSIDLSGGTNAAPTGQGVLDKATINATPGYSCVTN